ncbi:MAG: hypothetical protein IPK83_10805 [Planctomycetes bacterium]|nr:hypothetical protein [Planctomycetota bacterium]
MPSPGMRIQATLYAATGYQHGYNKNAGSVFKSTDNGDHWTYVSADFFTFSNSINTRVRSLAVNASGDVFAGLEGAGVWRSTNGGANWSALNTGLGNLRVRAIAISPADEVYAATETAGVYLLSGTTWAAANPNLTNLATRCLAFGPGYILVGTAGGGIFKRQSGGNWSAANNGLTGLFLNAIHASASGTRLLACTDSGLFESNDDAASWHPLVGPFTGSPVWSAIDTGNNILIGAGTSIYLSDASGTQWTPAINGYNANACRTLLQGGAGRLFAGSFDNGLFRSTDNAQSWSPINEGLYGRTTLRLVVSSKGFIVAGTNLQGIFRSDINGAPWTGPILPTRNIFALAESPWSDLFAGNYTILPGGISDGHAWRSSDDGLNWTPLDNGPVVAMVSGFVFPASQQVICSTAWGMSSVRTSTSNGDLWSLLAPGPGNEAYCLARNPQGDLFIGSEGHGVLRYSASSQTWTNLGLATLSQQFSIVINSQGHVFVGNDGNVKGVYKSKANGDSLSPLNSFPSNFGYAILCLPNDDLYVGTLEKGIQYSNDGGSSWTTVNSGIPVSSCQALALGPDGHLYAGVAGFGVYRSVQPVVPQVPGDIDGDGDVDVVDVDVFVNVLLGNETLPIRIYRSDLNADGIPNSADIESMTSAFLNP